MLYSGDPQDSILYWVLFNIFINDLGEENGFSSDLKMTQIWKIASTSEDNHKFQKEIDRLEHWLYSIFLNGEKRFYI